MSYRSPLSLAIWLTISSCGLAPRHAQAGPLLDWLFGHHRHAAPAYPVGPAVPVAAGTAAGYGGYVAGYGLAPSYAGNYGTYYSSQLPAIGPAGAGYTAPMPTGIAAATLPAQLPPTLSYVPNYQTYAQRAPVTYYRPLLTTDPTTGAQVVAMAPCTSYEYMAQRVPTLGRSAMFGTASPAVVAAPPQTLPTYTLPSGGVPLSYSAPSITAPYSTAYGAYGTSPGYSAYSGVQPPQGSISSPALGLPPTSIGPAGSYPTSPLGQSSYYGTTTGGSSGGYSGSSAIPGLVAPPAAVSPSTSYPSVGPQIGPPPTTLAPAPGYGPIPSTTSPSDVYPPGYPGGVLPGGSPDPANVPPQLPRESSYGASAQSSLRPQLRSITRQPRSDESSTAGSAGSDLRQPSSRDLPSMLPIPVPEDFEHQPRWNPPLLRDGDMTALRAHPAEVAELAGQSKPIHWASFEQPRTQQPADTQPSPTSGRLRPIMSPSISPAPGGDVSAGAARREVTAAPRQTGGWTVVRP